MPTINARLWRPKSETSHAGTAPDQALAGLGEVALARKRGPAPVHLWNPPYCGDIDMRIAADGTWFYRGSPIGRAPLVQLFASILRKDEDRYVLVTPVERVGIQRRRRAVPRGGDAASRTPRGEPQIVFRTNVDDFVAVDAEHPLRFEAGAADGVKPYVRVRGDLWALVKRALFYDLVALGRDRGLERRGLVRRALEGSLLSDAARERDRGALSILLSPDFSAGDLRRARPRPASAGASRRALSRPTVCAEGQRLFAERAAARRRDARAGAARRRAGADRRARRRPARAADPARVALARAFRPGRLPRRQDRSRRDARGRPRCARRRRRSGSRRASSSRSDGSIPISPAPAFASRRWSRSSIPAFTLDDQRRRSRRRVRDAVRLPDGPRQPSAAGARMAGRSRENSTRCRTASAISGARPPASCAISMRGCFPDGTRRSRNRFAVSRALRAVRALSAAAPALSAGGRALDARPAVAADARRARRRGAWASFCSASPRRAATASMCPRISRTA